MSGTSGFHVSINGEIVGAKMIDVDDVYCKYSMNYGSDWNVLYGMEHGITQICQLNPGQTDSTFTWNYPVDISFKSSNPHGWPQLVVSIYRINALGKDIVAGYGSVHIPTTPGRHVRYIRIYSPVSSSMCQRVMAWMLGAPPEFFTAKFAAQGRGREVTRVRSSGVVKVVFNVTTRNMAQFGYESTDGAIYHTNKPQNTEKMKAYTTDTEFGQINTGKLRSTRLQE